MPVDKTADRHRRIVVGVDGSAGSRAALRWAASKTDLLGHLQPMAAWRYPFWATGAPVPGNPAPPPREWFESRAIDQAREATKHLDPTTYLDPIAIPGHPGRVLCETAADATLLVVGSRGRTALAETALGSVSSYCAAHTKSPLAIIPEDAATTGMSQITVGVDGSDNSVAALTWVLDHAPIDAEVSVLHCLAPIGPAFEIMLSYRDALRERGQAALDDTIAEATRRTEREGALPAMTGSVVIGDPRAVLHERDTDLVVVGARGHRGVSHLLLGSVATSLAHKTERPTIIVPA